MTKSKKQLLAELEALKEELPKRETIGALLDTEGFQLAIADYKNRFIEAVESEDKKDIGVYKKNFDLLIDFKAFLETQLKRAGEIPELISDIECDLQQRDLFNEKCNYKA